MQETINRDYHDKDTKWLRNKQLFRLVRPIQQTTTIILDLEKKHHTDLTGRGRPLNESSFQNQSNNCSLEHNYSQNQNQNYSYKRAHKDTYLKYSNNKDDQYRYIQRKLRKLKMVSKPDESIHSSETEDNHDYTNKTILKDDVVRVQSQGFQNHFRNLVKKSKNISQQMSYFNHFNNFPYLTQKDKRISASKQKNFSFRENLMNSKKPSEVKVCDYQQLLRQQMDKKFEVVRQEKQKNYILSIEHKYCQYVPDEPSFEIKVPVKRRQYNLQMIQNVNQYQKKQHNQAISKVINSNMKIQQSDQATKRLFSSVNEYLASKEKQKNKKEFQLETYKQDRNLDQSVMDCDQEWKQEQDQQLYEEMIQKYCKLEIKYLDDSSNQKLNTQPSQFIAQMFHDLANLIRNKRLITARVFKKIYDQNKYLQSSNKIENEFVYDMNSVLQRRDNEITCSRIENTMMS